MALTRAQALALIELLYTGISLRKAVGDDPSARRRFFEMVGSDADLARRYAMAQEARAEILADEIVSIADSEPDPQRARVQMDARRWYAAKMKPRKYGERLEVAVAQQPDIRGIVDEMRRRAGLVVSAECAPQLPVGASLDPEDLE